MWWWGFLFGWFCWYCVFLMISWLEERKDGTGFRVVFTAVFGYQLWDVDMNKNRIVRLKILAIAS